MTTIQLIDVTLRDGGYQTSFNFPRTLVQTLLQQLDQAGLDYVEVGYRNGPLKRNDSMGSVAWCDASYLHFCRQHLQRSRMTVMVHPRHVQATDIALLRQAGVDAVRVCFPLGEPHVGFAVIDQALAEGLEVFVNFTHVSHHSQEHLRSFIQSVSTFAVRGIYLADSNGSLSPREVQQLFTDLAGDVPMGFHAHDNLYLAQANAVAAIDAGARFIDASLSGFGKGAGNLKLEGIVAFLHTQGNESYDMPSLLRAAQHVQQHFKTHLNPFKYLLMGMFDLSQDEGERLAPLNEQESYEWAKLYKQSLLSMGVS